MPSCRQLALALCAGLSLFSHVAAAAEPEVTKPGDAESSVTEPSPAGRLHAIRFTFANDVFAGADDHFTNGIGLAWAPPTEETWEQTLMPGFIADLFDNLPLLGAADRRKRLGFSAAQLMVTPRDIERRDVIRDDLPYSGTILLRIQAAAWNEQSFALLQLSAGMVGEVSQAEQAQTRTHELIGTRTPRGWDHQLENEPILNLDLLLARRLLSFNHRRSGFGLDLDLRVGGGAGNFVIYGSGGGALRLGWGLLDGFEVTPLENRAISADFQDYERSPPWSIYLSSIVEGLVFGRSLLIEGNTFRDSRHTVDLQYLQAKAAQSLVMRYEAIAIRLSAIVTTPSFEENDKDFERLGAIDVTIIF